MTRRVILVTGSAPPDHCGVGDYTFLLADALRKSGQPTELFCLRDWSVTGTVRALRKLSSARDAIVHIQYPTMGYGYSLGPHLCALATSAVVTIHEYSLAHWLRKLSLIPLTLRSPRVVMTSDSEREALLKRIPWLRDRIRMIPIGSNIPVVGETRNRDRSMLQFGLIMPRKGLEDFIELARLVRLKRLDLRMCIVGQIAPGQHQYAQKLIEASKQWQVDWVLDQDPQQVGSILAHAGLGYFPFPDGASDRRGSLRAALAAGLPCITTRSELTPPGLAGVVRIASTPAQALDSAMELFERTEELSSMSKRGKGYVKQFAWERIAELHVQMYHESPLK